MWILTRVSSILDALNDESLQAIIDAARCGYAAMPKGSQLSQISGFSTVGRSLVEISSSIALKLGLGL
jgi:hypothetical protein